MTHEIGDLLATLEAIRRDIEALDAAATDFVAAADPAFAANARNLVHHVGLRRHDVRGLEDCVAGLGLSSLGRAFRSLLTRG
jgi:pyruvate kinase